MYHWNLLIGLNEALCLLLWLAFGQANTLIIGSSEWGERQSGVGLTPATYCKYSMFHGLYSTFDCYYSIYIFVPSDLFGCRPLSSYLPTAFSILARS